jgi:hypothetical protein
MINIFKPFHNDEEMYKEITNFKRTLSTQDTPRFLELLGRLQSTWHTWPTDNSIKLDYEEDNE